MHELPARVTVKVVPGSSRNVIAGWLGDTLRVRAAAPPEKGKANASVEKLIAESLGLPLAAVSIIKGKTSSRKVVEITGSSQSEVMRKLRLAAPPASP